MKRKNIKRIISLFIVMLVMLSGCTATNKDHYEEAMKYMEEGDKVNALASIDKAIEADPENAELYVRRAYIKMTPDKDGVLELEIDSILADLEKALQLDPDNEEAMRGIYYAEIYRNNYDEAATRLKELIEGKDISSETQELLKEAEEGNISDLLGRIRTKTYYRDGKLVWKEYYDYGKDNRVSSIRAYDANNALIGQVDVQYDQFGNHLQWASYMEDGSMFREEHVYDDKGREEGYEMYRMDGSLYCKVSYGYDDTGNRIREEYDYATLDDQVMLTEYDDEGKMLSAHYYDGDGNILYYYVLNYDEQGRVVRNDTYDGNGSLSGYLVQKYDEEGNWLGYQRYDSQGTLVFESANE